MKNITVVIPVYNEEDSVIEVTDQVKEVLSPMDIEWELIMVNDGSSDNSLEVMRGIEGITVINHPYRKGYGAALKTGIKASQFDDICIIDADGTYPVDAIPELLKYTDEYDMVVGARTGFNVTIPYMRKFAKWFITKLANYLVGVKIPDLNSGLRIFRKEPALINMHILPSGFSFTTTITIAMLTGDYFVKFLPIDYYERTGSSKIRPVKHTLEFLLLVSRLIVYFKPLKVFIPPSVFLLVVGFLRTVYTVVTRDKIHEFSLMTLIMGMMLFLIGLLADMFVKSRGVS